MKLKEAIDEKKLDLRIQDRLISEGKLTTKEVQEAQKKLPDCEGHYKKIEDRGRKNY